MPNFDNAIFELYEDDFEAADRIIKRIVLAQLAKEINEGSSQPLFRPIFSYGIVNLEDAYHVFACSISEYFAKPNAWYYSKCTYFLHQDFRYTEATSLYYLL